MFETTTPFVRGMDEIETKLIRKTIRMLRDKIKPLLSTIYDQTLLKFLATRILSIHLLGSLQQELDKVLMKLTLTYVWFLQYCGISVLHPSQHHHLRYRRERNCV